MLLILKKILKEDIISKNSYEGTIENFDILTDKMDDNFIPYRIEQNVIMWLSEEGIVGEIECIFPQQIDKELILTESQNLLIKKGFPLISIEDTQKMTEVKVFKGKDYFILYFSELADYDQQIESNDLSFYFKDKYLIAIKAILS